MQSSSYFGGSALPEIHLVRGATGVSAHVAVGGTTVVGTAADDQFVSLAPETQQHDQGRDKLLATVGGFSMLPVAAALIAIRVRAR